MLVKDGGGFAQIQAAVKGAKGAEMEALFGMLGDSGLQKAVELLGREVKADGAPERRSAAIRALARTQSGAEALVGMAKEGSDAPTIVTHYFPGTTVAPTQDDMDIRVSLYHQVPTAKLRAQALENGGGAVEVTVGGNVVPGGPNDVFAFSANGSSVSVTKNGADLGSAPVVAVHWAGTRAPNSAQGGATAVNIVGPNGAFDTPGHRYRYGWVDVTAVGTPSGARLNVVNTVRLHDEYLYGIAEVSNSWPAAALQAQVIAARSYALAKVAAGLRKACSCHLDDGNGPYGDQTFAGWTKQASAKGDQWTAAVNATLAGDTQGLAALYAGRPISAFYTASTGGATTAVRDVWGGDIPYSVSVDDHWSLAADNPNASWQVRVPQAAVAKAFGVPGVWKLDVTERFTGGAAKTVTATLQDGSQKAISGGAFRSALGLKSQYVTAIDGQTGAAAAAPGTAPTPPPPSVSMIVSRTKPRPGTSITFKGRVIPAMAGLDVERQMLVNGAWTVKAKAKTKANGRYSFKIKKTVPAGAKYTYRVVVYINGAIAATSREAVVSIRKR